MNSCVFLSVALLIVVAVHADIVADLNAHYKACAEENNISTEQLNSLRSTVDKYSIQASDDLKVSHSVQGHYRLFSFTISV